MDPLLIVMLVVAVIGWTGAVVGAVLAFANGRRANTIAGLGGQLALNEYIDKRVDELVQERLGDIKVRTFAFARILRSLATQWPVGHPPPLLDPADIKAVEDSIPASWLPARTGATFPEEGGSS